MDVVFAVEDPGVPDVLALLERHLAFAHEVTPEGHVHALDVDALRAPDVTFFSARADGELVGVVALRELDDEHAELKSMHVAEAVRGRGVGTTIVRHVLGVAGERDYRRVSLETGTYPAFAPARALYEGLGFDRCEPFAEYTDNPYSTCLTIEIAPGVR